jgi:hypothetical protein
VSWRRRHGGQTADAVRGDREIRHTGQHRFLHDSIVEGRVPQHGETSNRCHGSDDPARTCARPPCLLWLARGTPRPRMIVIRLEGRREDAGTDDQPQREDLSPMGDGFVESPSGTISSMPPGALPPVCPPIPGPEPHKLTSLERGIDEGWEMTSDPRPTVLPPGRVQNLQRLLPRNVVLWTTPSESRSYLRSVSPLKIARIPAF